MSRLSSPSSHLPLDLALSAATVPLLLGLIGTKLVARTVIELGQASEELFRGDRLPLLNLANTSTPDQSPHS